jgi:hypothetical protein
MKARIAAVTGAFAATVFVAGMLWQPPAEALVLTPTPPQVALFMLLGIAEAIAFGFGVSFLLFGYGLVRAVDRMSAHLGRAAHLSIAWFLVSWWPHDSLHMRTPFTPGNLLGIEYAFHVTLMVAAGIVVYAFLRVARVPRTVAP